MSYETVPLEDFGKVFGSTSTEISSAALNGHVVSVSDEFFAAASQLLEVAPAPSLKGQFGPNGALFSGWESRRHNPAYDWCIVKLGVPSGHVIGFDIDTAHFSGNEAPQASVEAFFAEPGSVPPKWDDQEWVEILPKVNLGPSSRHLFKIPQTEHAYTHVKLNMYPDGGIARFRVYGLVSPIFPADTSVPLDLAHVFSGGRVVAVSDQHFGVGPNLLLPGRGKDMGDGWETRRSRAPGHTDWVIIKLGVPGALEQVEIDTAHFIGNFPESCEVHATQSSETIPPSADGAWDLVLSRTKLGPHRRHFFQLENTEDKVYSHVRVTIYPDGGIKRIRVIGRRAAGGQDGTSSELVEPALTSSDKQLPSIPQSATQDLRARAVIPAVPLTSEAFAPFGDVIQAWSSPHHAPKGTRVTTANQGTAFKFHDLSSIVSSYPSASGGETGPPRVSVYRSTPPKELDARQGGAIASTWDVKILERHQSTNQVFIPMGTGVTHGNEEDALPEAGRAYLVIVAQNGPDDKPNLDTLRAFLASTAQGIAYGTGIWHHPMISLATTIDFTCIETQIGTLGNILDCEVVNVGEGDIPVVQIPAL